jgi:hypothetical protein
LGERWHTETNSFKIYPVCGYLCSAIDATLQLLQQKRFSTAEIVSIDIWANLFTVAMDAHSAPYLDGPRSRISTLTFSTPFTVASTILAGNFTAAQLQRSWIEDQRVWQLAKKVKVHHDMDLTLEALSGDIPIGAALRYARRWQAAAFALKAAATAFGRLGRWRHPATFRLLARLVAAADRRPLDFSSSTKPLGARVKVLLKNGEKLEGAAPIARGFAGSVNGGPGRKTVRELMRNKFVEAATPIVGWERAMQAADLIEHLDSLSAKELARFFDLACLASFEHGSAYRVAVHEGLA